MNLSKDCLCNPCNTLDIKLIKEITYEILY